MDPGQFFTTSASLVDLVDKKMLVALRDGRKLFGILRSYDQFANLVLQDTIERYFALPNYYADQHHGLFLVRGENVVLLGEVDLELEDDMPMLERRDLEFVKSRHQDEVERRKRKEKLQQRVLKERFGIEDVETNAF